MGWGGPRFEFYTTNQYNNFTACIQRENAARVRAILEKRNREKQESAVQSTVLQGIAQGEAKSERHLYVGEASRERVYGQVQSSCKDEMHAHESGGCISNKSPERIDQLSRLQRLANAKKYSHMSSVGHRYGQFTNERGNVVRFPVGRNGASYSPGIDRDRIVPEPPSRDIMPPWIGSFSSHVDNPKGKWGKLQGAQKVRRINLASLHTRRMRPERASMLREIAAAHLGEDSTFEKQEEPNEYGVIAIESSEETGQLNTDNEKDDVSSVFSHALSNAPIFNTASRHLAFPVSTKAQVLEHLQSHKYPKPNTHAHKGSSTSCTLNDMKEWSLPQLTFHVLTLQRECMQKCKERTI